MEQTPKVRLKNRLRQEAGDMLDPRGVDLFVEPIAVDPETQAAMDDVQVRWQERRDASR